MNLQQTIDILAARKLHGRLVFQGLDISIENRKGSTRRGVAKDGTKWATKMTYDYGYVRMSVGADGDHVDCFIGPKLTASNAYIIAINHPDTGKYDEDKVFLGFSNAKAAKKAFDANYDRPEKFFRKMTVMSMSKFKQVVLAKENHGERLDMKGGETQFVSSLHLDMLPNVPPEKVGKSKMPNPDADGYHIRQMQQKYPQPLMVNQTAVQHQQGGTTPFAFTQVYGSGKKK